MKRNLDMLPIAGIGLLMSAAAMTISFQNCSPSSFQQVGSGNTTAATVTPDGPPTDPGAPVCDPFNNGNSTTVSSKNGVLSTLTYIPPASHVIQDGLSTQSFEPGKPDVREVSHPVYLSRFSVFTQDFSLGFDSGDGKPLQDNSGNQLDEYFSLRSQALLGLDQSGHGGISEAGYYQLAMLSDDGATLDVGTTTGELHSLINDDGTHSNRFACSTAAVYLKAGQQIPFQLNYYQGPRVRIAMMLFARKVDPNNQSSFADDLCGGDGSSATTADDAYFFTKDSATNQPVPTTAYSDSTPGSKAGILNRGWKVIPASNFFLPNQAENPCASTNAKGAKR